MKHCSNCIHCVTDTHALLLGIYIQKCHLAGHNILHPFVSGFKCNLYRKRRNIVFTGEEQPRAKLTKKAVKNARWERAYKGTSFQALADRYGVSKKTMQNAIKGVTWKCVPYMPEPPKGE